MLAWLFLTYIIAAIPFGLVLTTLYGGELDIRAAGSGNIGTTNVARLYGWRLAVPALIADVGKGAVFTAGARLMWPDAGLWWPALIAATAFLAHCYSVYLEFRGGKGVATALGGMLAISPLPALLAVVVWVGVLKLSGRSSVAALTAATSLIGWCAWLDPPAVAVVLFLAVGIAFTHTSNIRRLMAGEEAQVVRPVRWGRQKEPDAAALMEQGPSGQGAPPPVWRATSGDPLDPTEDVAL